MLYLILCFTRHCEFSVKWHCCVFRWVKILQLKILIPSFLFSLYVNFFIEENIPKEKKTVNLTKISVWAIIQTGDCSVQRETLEFKTSSNNSQFIKHWDWNLTLCLGTKKMKRIKRKPRFDYHVIALTFFCCQQSKTNKQN